MVSPDSGAVKLRGAAARVIFVSGSQAEYPCPCCGHLMFVEPPGSYDICHICYWEDDAVQLRWPLWAGGANGPSLVQSQVNFIEFGAMEDRFVRHVRPPQPTERLDEGWRLVDLRTDRFEPTGEQFGPWPEDMTLLYWWRPTFWRGTPD
jgi:hypothetical protein